MKLEIETVLIHIASDTKYCFINSFSEYLFTYVLLHFNDKFALPTI